MASNYSGQGGTTNDFKRNPTLNRKLFHEKKNFLPAFSNRIAQTISDSNLQQVSTMSPITTRRPAEGK